MERGCHKGKNPHVTPFLSRTTWNTLNGFTGQNVCTISKGLKKA